MEKTCKTTVASIALLLSLSAPAVNLSHKGHGEVLIYPYYTVNNQLNTIYSVVNINPEAKAIKIRFLEGEAGREVLDFNVYLGPFDVWSGALVPAVSNIPGHVGEPTASHVTADRSCAPFLLKNGQEFLPFVIDASDPGNTNLQRARDGQIVVMEMGTVTGSTAAALSHGNFGVPFNCKQLQDAWEFGGYWTNDSGTDINPPNGGLFGNASVINVAEGIAFGYPAVALEDFWQGNGSHTEPGALLPTMNAAFPQSEVILNGQIQVSNWASGAEAVTAVLMQYQIFNEYDFDSEVAGKSEWVISFPTKNLHVNNNLAIQPFNEPWNGFSSCDDFEVVYWDRNTIATTVTGNISPRPPEGLLPRFCHQTNVLEFLSDDSEFSPTSLILGADNLNSIAIDNTSVTENGWAAVTFDPSGSGMTPINGAGYIGLPAVGFQVQQITNTNAGEGLIAQYGRLFVHKGISVNQ